MMSRMKPVKKIAVIHDICGIGKAAMTNIMPILSVMGIEVCPIPTMLLSTHTGGYGKPYIQSLDGYMAGCLAHYLEQDVCFDMIFVGYLGTNTRIQEVKDFLTKYREKYSSVSVILDPIFGDNGVCYSNFTMEYVSELKLLLPYADCILPNYTECCMLFDEKISLYSDVKLENNTIKQLAYKANKIGLMNMVVTSIPRKDSGSIGIFILEAGKTRILEFDKENQSCHGTGDIFAAVFCGALLQGDTVIQACERAHRFVADCLEESEKYDYPKREGVVLEPILSHLISV